MIVDELRSSEQDGRVERSASVRWEGGDFRLFVATPPALASSDVDASPFLCATLLLAMRLGEDLELRAAVSGGLLERVPRIVDLYAQWDPRLHRSRVRAERELAPGTRAGGVGCFFSRGVDSMYSAAVPRGLPGALTQLVHCDRLEPLHSPGTRAEELRLASDAAQLLGLSLVVIQTNLRELSDPVVGDWADMAGAGLAFLATAMAGGLGHMVIPSSAAPTTLIASGTSPLLDPMFSTDDLEIHHDVPATRPAKVAWLARERPDLLPCLKVCWHEDRPDNCGRCPKCVLTMLSLEAAGSLGLARGFPPEVDPEALAAAAPRGLQPREEFRDVERELRARPSPSSPSCARTLRRSSPASSVMRRPTATTPGGGRASRKLACRPEWARGTASLVAVSSVPGRPAQRLSASARAATTTSSRPPRTPRTRRTSC